MVCDVVVRPGRKTDDVILALPLTSSVYCGFGLFIPIFPLADPENGFPDVVLYDPVPNKIPPILIPLDTLSGRVIFVPIIILLDPIPLVGTMFQPA